MTKIKKQHKQSGFTLIEILVVLGIVAILATIVLIAINPARQFAQARDTQRISNINAILNAIGQRIADNKGVFEGTFVVSGTTYTCGALPATAISITSGGSVTAGDLGCLVPTYMTIIPTDPKPTASGSYRVSAPDGGRITVDAPSAEITTPISVTR